MPIGELVERNDDLRTNERYGTVYMSFESLIFFGQLGNGDLFGQPVIQAAVREEVFVWDHEDDSRTWYAADIASAILRLFAPASQHPIPSSLTDD